MRPRWTGALAVVVFAAAPLAAAGPTIRMAPLAARFYYSDTGQWSGNKLDAKGQFTGWNTGAGEGDAGGSADDVMIELAFSAPGNSETAIFVDKPVTIRAVAGKKLLGARTIRNLLIPVNRRAHAALFLTDIACAERIDVTAKWGTTVRTARLNMDCGE